MRSGHVLITADRARDEGLGLFRGLVVWGPIVVLAELFLFACLAIGMGWWTP